MSVDLNSKKGEKLISKPAGFWRKLQPVAIFLYSKLYAVVLTIKNIPNANKPITNVWKKIDLNFSSEKKPKLDLISSIYKKNGGFKTPRFKFN